MNSTTLRAIPALLAMVFSGAATAGGFQITEQSLSGLGVAHAGSAAVAENAGTIFYNPAGMALLSGFQISTGVAAIGPNTKFQNGASTETTGNNGGNASSWAAVPNSFASMQLTRDLSVGIGVSAPFGLKTDYDSNWYGRAQAIKSEVKTINVNPSLAYRVNDKVALGFGLNYQAFEAEFTKSGVVLKGDDASWGWNAGVLFTLSPAMRVGASYRSAVKHQLEGDLNGVLPVQSEVKLPDTFILSVWQQVSDRWEAMGDLSYTRWDSLQRMDVYNRSNGVLVDSDPLNYRNAWRLAWGAAYKASDRLKLKFGVAYDQSPITDANRSARLPDGNRVWLTLGSQWDTGRLGKIDLGYAYLHVTDPTINHYDAASGTTLNGRYDSNAHIVGMQYSVGF